MSLCGRFDEHLKLVEQRLGVEIQPRGNIFHIRGPELAVGLAKSFLKDAYQKLANGQELTPHKVHIDLQPFVEQLDSDAPALDTPEQPNISIKVKRGRVKPRSQNQTKYLQSIDSFDINFGVGPAGTGKTYLAVACAIAALENQEVRRILLVRPAVEAGERLGFLPGDLAQKIDPYLRPLFDALYEMVGVEKATKLIETNVIEVAPLAYMRGRTLNDAFVILDEAQNTTPEQMKMFLTRMGFSSKVVITGDITQIDLPSGSKSGLIEVISILKDIEGIAFTYFEAKDVIRHPLVQKIVKAYDKHGGNK